MQPSALMKQGLQESHARALAIAVNFLSKIEPDPASDCWLWHGAHDALGYGDFRFEGRFQPATRVSLMLLRGLSRPFATALVLHSCDNPRCVNPDHLRYGTQAENMADMRQKGRGVNLVGSLCGQSKLTESQVIEIRASTDSHRTLGKRYGVTRTCIGEIKRRATWRHI